MSSTLGLHWDVFSKDGKKHKNVVAGDVREKVKNDKYLIINDKNREAVLPWKNKILSKS